ncbi:hypothetical protein KDA_31500 [Dictyobacter alpinus]|uniref:DUF2269 domain-containing protein n=1 Tax=Dictyobacter alpinus TaxID=2014873 RepID=A0A402B8L1_9CHLR|nr:hypothetical protein [Dictyobacter alpinus]GCE27666.1 hypothetical protein KDA_31500 [Dictyobacter alpinus]
MLYPYLLLLHIVGVCGLFIALSLEVIIMSRLQVAKTTLQVHEWLTLSPVIHLVLPASAVFILVSGLALAWTAWGWGHAWIVFSLGLLVLLGILGPVINGPRMKAIHVAALAAPVGEISPALRRAIAHPVLQTYVPIPILAALGAVVMMVLKLDWPGSGIVIALILIASLILAGVRQGQRVCFLRSLRG